MDKNKWIQEKIKEICIDLNTESEYDGEVNCSVEKLTTALCQSLKEAWERGEVNIADDDEAILVQSK